MAYYDLYLHRHHLHCIKWYSAVFTNKLAADIGQCESKYFLHITEQSREVLTLFW